MVTAGNFDVNVERDGTALVISPRGEVDLATVDIVRDAVKREYSAGQALVIDLREVGFMDTSGLRLVLELNDRAGKEGFAFRIVRGSSAVQRVFEVAGLEPRLPFVDEPSQDPVGSD